MATGSSVPGAEKGMEYQYQVISYMLVSLLNNPNVEDFIIYANFKIAGKFDDVVMKVWFHTELHPHLYMVQVKFVSSNAFDISDNKKVSLSSYVKSFVNFTKKKDQTEFFTDVPKENIKCWYFSNAFVDKEEVRVFERGQHLLTCTLNSVTFAHTTIIPIVKNVTSVCCKLHCRSNLENYRQFCEKFYLLLEQPAGEEICEEIKKISGISDSAVTKYVERFFKNTELFRQGLTKEIFEVEMLLVRLSTHMPVVSTGTLSVNTARASIWNKITLTHDVTIVGNCKGVDRLLYDCCLQKVNELFGQTFDWDYYLKTQDQFDETVIEKFRHFAQGKRYRHWLAEPKTVQSLLQELWVYGEVPLILATDSDLSILHKFKYLRKKYIIVSRDIGNMHAALSPFYANIFTNIGDICDYSLREELLRSISISLQGRKPVSLRSIMGEDPDSMVKFTCAELLNLMMRRSVYLGNNFIENNELMIYVIEDANSQNDCDRIEDIRSEEQRNIVTTCQNSEEVKKYFLGRIQDDGEFRNYSLCRLRKTKDKFQFIEGDLEKLRYFLVDERGNDIYYANLEEPALIIGQRPRRKIRAYVPRCLSKSEVLESVIDTREKRIFLVSGDTESLNASIKDRIIEYSTDEDAKFDLEVEDVAFVKVKDSFEDDWRLLSSKGYQLIHVKVIDGCLILVEHRNCTKMISYSSYTGSGFDESRFPEEVDSKVVVLNGESGIGKSTLLQSLVETSDGQNYVLFCNLADLRDELKLDKKLLQSPLDFLFAKYEKSSYKELLDPIFRYHRDAGRLTVFIDSFDEMLPLTLGKDTALVLMKNIAESGVNVVIASTFTSGNLLMNNLLLNNIKIQPVRINYIRPDEWRYCLEQAGFFGSISEKIPHELLLNPLHLEYILFYYKKGALDFASCDTSDVCEKIIMKRIEQYYRGVDQAFVLDDHNANKAQKEDILKVHRHMALAQMFGTEFAMQYIPRYGKLIQEFQDIKIRLGIVKGFKGTCPRFTNIVFVEFLVKQWFAQGELDEGDKSDFVRSYNDKAKHFAILPEELVSDEMESDDFES